MDCSLEPLAFRWAGRSKIDELAVRHKTAAIMNRDQAKDFQPTSSRVLQAFESGDPGLKVEMRPMAWSESSWSRV